MTATATSAHDSSAARVRAELTIGAAGRRKRPTPSVRPIRRSLNVDPPLNASIPPQRSVWGTVFPIAMIVGAHGDARRGAAYVVGGQRVGDLAGPDLRLTGQPAAVPGQDFGSTRIGSSPGRSQEAVARSYQDQIPTNNVSTVHSKIVSG